MSQLLDQVRAVMRTRHYQCATDDATFLLPPQTKHCLPFALS